MTALLQPHLLDLADETPWQDRALCAQTDPEAFFPEKGGSTREAKKVCQSCDVRLECLQYALDNDERFGIWGGLSERERRARRPARRPTGHRPELDLSDNREAVQARARRAAARNGVQAVDTKGRT